MIDLAIAIISATAGQVLLLRHNLWGLGLYAPAILLLLAALRREGPGVILPMTTQPPTPALPVRPDRPWYRRYWRPLSLPPALTSATLAALWASDNTYRWYGVVAWLLAVGLSLLIFWERDPRRPARRWPGLSRTGWRLSWTALAVAALILIGFWFRFWRLAELPPEMTSDHVEKLLDVHDLTTGQRPIFFTRNTGREPWQFYWTLMFMRLLNLDTRFLALKVGTAVVGLLTLPGVYLLGRELFGRWVGLWATLFTAVAIWPVAISRIGLRFPFAPAATAWSLLFLLRGLRDGRRNDFLLLGLSLGIGLHGYTAFRAMPLAVVVCWGLTWLLTSRRASPPGIIHHSSLIHNALLSVLIAVVVFIPLGRYALEHPDNFWMRSASRMADPGRPMPDGFLLTLLQNLKDLFLMFHWRGDNVWVNTLPGEPVLDPLLGGLLILGVVIVLWRGLRLRDPIAPLLLLAGGILLLPSALSLAYPIENPSVVRAAGAIPAVMVIAALPVGWGLERGWSVLEDQRRGLLALSALALAVTVTAINYQRYFDAYSEQYQERVLNTSEIATAIRDFAESGGDLTNAWIIAWPHWVDTRGVGIELGDPTWNNVILKIEELDTHTELARPRFYTLYPQDLQTLGRLQALFPQGWSSLYRAKRPERSFILFYVPARPSAASAPVGGPASASKLGQGERAKTNAP